MSGYFSKIILTSHAAARPTSADPPVMSVQ